MDEYEKWYPAGNEVLGNLDITYEHGFIFIYQTFTPLIQKHAVLVMDQWYTSVMFHSIAYQTLIPCIF